MTDTKEVQDREVIAAYKKCAKLLLHLWARTRMDWGYVTDSLAGAFRQNRGLGSSDRRFIAETLYGMVRYHRRVDEALALGGIRFTNQAPDAERLVCFLFLEGGLSREAARALMPKVNWQQAEKVDEEIAKESKASVRLARLHSVPDWLGKVLVDEKGEDQASELLEALNQRAPLTIRANTLAESLAGEESTPRDALVVALGEEGATIDVGKHGPWALHVSSRGNVFAFGAFKKGLFEVQDEGSQLIAEIVAPPPGGLLVDYCAGAGGKALALAGMLGNKGRIVACDVDKKKLVELKRRASRAGVTNTRTVLLERDSENLSAVGEWVNKAARVLVDAPCTGVGALRRNPEARWRLAKTDIAKMAGLQKQILDDASKLVAPGGRLIYATCSLLAAENTGVVDDFLAKHSNFSVMTVKEIVGKERGLTLSSDGKYLELSPVRHGTDGFFAAVLRRSPQG